MAAVPGAIDAMERPWEDGERERRQSGAPQRPAAALHCEVASKAKGLSRFSELLDAVKLFMEEKDKDYPELSDPKWLVTDEAVAELEMIKLSEEDRLKPEGRDP
ncbi:hypothetical protein NHX12_023106 [Muraenolepis orangiensis]|uniref:Uncharacterized protein n=1 Tax=Muraenolepis orangiensis TaxID=630683 RepID=A0A9Q0ISG2_9TELE|nr:hypothetical protein NHX12_023106 [Muraenolepis orangiensis]